MNEAYDWYEITSTQVGAFALHDALQEVVDHTEARLIGVFRPEFGLSTRTRLCLVGWPSERADLTAAFTAIDDVSEVRCTNVRATVRPTSIEPVVAPGMYVHRWFEFPADNWAGIFRLSQEAWPTWEARFEVEVIGFWLAEDDRDGVGRALLLSRYRSFAEWERSRPDADGPKDDAHRKFIRRFFLTDSSVAVATRLVT